MKNVLITVIAAIALNVYAGTPRCAGNPDPAKCEKEEAALAAETPRQKAARIARLEASRTRSMEAANKQPKYKRGVSIGMSKEEVLASTWGKPNSVNRTTDSNGTREQWVYGLRNYLYFDNGVLTSIQN